MKRYAFYGLAIGLLLSSATLWAMKPVETQDWVVHNYDTRESGGRHHPVPYIEERGRLFTTGCAPRPARESSRMEEYNGNPRTLRGRENTRIQRESIVNKVDGRKRITPTTTWPTTIHGQISIGMDGDPHAAGGSGTFVGPRHFLTAAHCVFGDEMKGWAESLTVRPALDDSTAPFGGYKVSKVYAYKAWTEESLNMADYDLALLVLSRPVGYETGWAGLLSLSTEELRKIPVSVTGYPGDKGCKQLWSMEDTLRHIDEEIFSYKIDTYSGQSGGAVWTLGPGEVPGLVGVHTNGCRDRNLGVRLSQKKFQDILTWMEETGGFGASPLTTASSSSAAPGVGVGWSVYNLIDRCITPIEDDPPLLVQQPQPLVEDPPQPPTLDLPTYTKDEAQRILQEQGLLSNPAQHLLSASTEGDIETVNLLLAGCPEVSVEETRKALMAARKNKDKDMIQLFIKNAETRPGYDTIVLKGSMFFAVRE